MTSTRLTALDASFLRVEGPTSHMHVGWRGAFEVDPSRERPALAALRESIASRLRHAPGFRQRLAFPPMGLGEPLLVDDENFDIAFHVRRLGDPYVALGQEQFQAAADAVLSEPLDRRRPLWEVFLAPRLDDGRVGLVMKMHHAMADGISAVKLAMLVLHVSPDAGVEEVDRWKPAQAPGDSAMALRAVTDSAGESLRAARGLAAFAGAPLSGSGRLADGLRRTALAVGDDLLRSAPSSYVNCRIGPKRKLVGCSIRLDRLQAIKQRTATTHNDVCLTLVSGAMREVARTRGEQVNVLRAMVPVSMRAPEPDGGAGNRISFAFVDLPLEQPSARARLEAIHAQTQKFKQQRRAAGTESLMSALRFAPPPVKSYAARLAGSARVYNLTVSNVPGPQEPLYMLGARLTEAFPVVPLTDDHALSVGMFTYSGAVHFGLYADPDSLPEVAELPLALHSAMMELDRATRVRSRQRGGRGPARSGSATVVALHGRHSVAAEGEAQRR